MYLSALVIGTCLAYIFWIYLFTALFTGRRASLLSVSVSSVVFIALFIIVARITSMSISDLWWGNRFQHAVGGGVLGVIICFLAMRDGRLLMNRFQFLVMAVLAVTAMGVGNEILEYYAQTYFDVLAATTVDDTWLDLVSNTIGIGVAAIVLMPFVAYKGIRVRKPL